VRLVALSEESLAKKGPIKFTCLDYDEAGNDYLGTCELDLYKITSAAYSQMNKSRTYDGNLTLYATGEKTQMTVSVKAWFEPEIDEKIKLSKDTKTQEAPASLPKEFLDREKSWRESIPMHLISNDGYQIQALDENKIPRFLPTYLTKLVPPAEMRNPLAIFRMIQCFTYSSDKETFSQDDIWTSPNFFMEIKKGDSEDHAILMFNLFLGIDLDVYLCRGKTKFGVDHVWLMTREPEGSVTFWEPSLGKTYLLPSRWKGTIKVDDNVEHKKEKENYTKFPEHELLFYDPDITLSVEEIVQESGYDDFMDMKTLPIRKDIQIEAQHEQEVFDFPLVDVPYQSIEVIFNHKNIWGNIQRLEPEKIYFDLEDAGYWHPYISTAAGFSPDIIPFYTSRRLGGKLNNSRVQAIRDDIYAEIVAGYTNWRHGKNMETVFYNPLTPVLEEGLRTLEKQKLTTDSLDIDIKQWQSRITVATKGGYHFKGVPISFTYTDSKMIRKWITSKYNFHEESTEDIQFACGVHVTPYFNSICSVWVFIAQLTKEKKS